MRAADRLTFAVLVAVVLSSWCLTPLTLDRAYIGLTAALAGASAVIAVIARHLRLPALAVRLSVLIPGLVLLVGVGIENIPEILGDTFAYVRESWAPMDPHDGFTLTTSFVLWLLYLIAEAVAVGLERPGWSFPPLVVTYLVPALVLPDETSPALFALVAIGYVVVLGTGAYGAQASRTDVPAGTRGLGRSIALTAVGAGLLAWLGTGFVATTLPERGTAWIDAGGGPGAILLGDPSQDLVRNIRANSNRTVITYQTEDGHGRYLRLTALSEFDAGGFHLVPTDLMPGPAVIPEAAVTDSPTSEITVHVEDFGSEWLPVPWVPQAWNAPGDWRYDPRTLSVVALGDNRQLATRGLRYSATVYDFQPSQDQVAAADAGDPADAGLTLQLPDGLDPRLRDLAREVTEGATTDGERMQRLTRWFHSSAFTYSLGAVPGSTLDTVADFLLTSRTGYCEQFSGSMAILARALGVPSRVVVGFLPGEKNGDSYIVSLRQMHAWTEVYLQGLGWVAFDPTPTGASGAAPVPTPTSSAGVPEPSAPVSTRQPEDPGAENPTSSPRTASFAWLVTVAWTLGGVAAALALATIPLGVRSWRRWRRLSTHRARGPADLAEDAWDEVRDEVYDAGHSWPSGTPRQVAAELAGLVHTSEAGAVKELALAVEQARFAPDSALATDPVTQARRIARGLHSNRGVTPGVLRRYFPRSVLRLPDWLRTPQ